MAQESLLQTSNQSMTTSINNEVLVSMDMDWAPDALIEDSVNLLNEHGVSATLFLTNPTRVDLTGHEIALHPNFDGADLLSPVAKLLDCFPGAVGTRSHSLFFSYRLVEVYEKLGIRYQSNVIAYKQCRLHGFQISRHVAEIPIFFMDNIHLLMEPESAAFNVDGLALAEPGLKVFDFHPIHVYLNTDNLDRYNAAKSSYQDPRQLMRFRNREGKGTRDLFVDLLRALAQRQKRARSMRSWLDESFEWTF